MPSPSSQDFVLRGFSASLGQNALLVLIGVVAVTGIVGAALSKDQGGMIFGFASMICVSLLSMLAASQTAARAEQDRRAKTQQDAEDRQKAEEDRKAVAAKVEEVKASAEEAKAAVKEVKKTLVESTDSTAEKLNVGLKIAKDTHTLVNSNMMVQLRLNAELSRWKASQTKTPEDIRAAELADKMVHEHEIKQAAVDSNNPADAGSVAHGAAEVADKASIVATQAAEVAKGTS